MTLPATAPANPFRDIGGRFAGNVATLAGRLRRRRFPMPARDLNRHIRVIGSGAVFAALVIVAFALVLDANAVAWAGGLPDAVGDFFRRVTRYGRSDWLLIPTGVFGLVLLAADWSAIERRVAAAWAEVGALLFYFFVAVAGAGLVTDLIKWLVGRSRPRLIETDGTLTFSPFAFDSVHFSFPSGHATTITAAAVACLLMMRKTRWIAAALVVFAVLVGLSRVAVRAHFPSDVVGGVLIGSAFAYGLALALGRTGVAFQRRPDGGLLPKTIAIRRELRLKPRFGALAAGLMAALSAHTPRAAVTEQKSE